MLHLKLSVFELSLSVSVCLSLSQGILCYVACSHDMDVFCPEYFPYINSKNPLNVRAVSRTHPAGHVMVFIWLGIRLCRFAAKPSSKPLLVKNPPPVGAAPTTFWFST